VPLAVARSQGYTLASSRLPTMATFGFLRGMRVLLSMKLNPWVYKFKDEASNRSESEVVVEFNLWELIRTNERLREFHCHL